MHPCSICSKNSYDQGRSATHPQTRTPTLSAAIRTSKCRQVIQPSSAEPRSLSGHYGYGFKPQGTLFAYHLPRPALRLRPRGDLNSFPYLGGRCRSVTGQTYNNRNTFVKCSSKKSCKSLIITEKNLHTEFKWVFLRASLLYYNT